MKRKLLAVILAAAFCTVQLAPQLQATAESTGQTLAESIGQATDESADEAIGLQADQADVQSLIYEAEEKLSLEQADYVERFIVKYASGKKDTAKMHKAAKKTFTKARKKKKEIEARYQEKLMKLDASVKQAYGIEAESASAETGETVQLSAMEGRNARYQVIELPESVDPKLFLEEIVPEIEETIDYIQPDYQMELSAEILDMDDAEEQISENAAEEQMLENAAEIEAAQEELAAKKSSLRGGAGAGTSECLGDQHW